MKTRELNLARRPFVNARPVLRLTALLWLVGAGLCVLNIALFWQYFSTTDESQQERTALQQRIKQHRERITENKEVLAKVDLLQLNAQVDFLNRKIAERTFAWSQLFDHLAEVLPNDVRLQNLAPNTEDERDRGRRGAVLPGGRVRMGIVGIAKTVEDELEFVDRLFAHPSFERPRLKGDSTQASGYLKFTLAVTYFPNRPSPEASKEPMEADRNEAPAPEAPTPAPAPRLASDEAVPPPPPQASRRAVTDPPPSAVTVAEVPPPAPRQPGARERQRRPRPGASEAEAPPADPNQRSRRNRRRPRNSNPGNERTPSVATGGGLVLPAGGTGRPGAEAPGRNPRQSPDRGSSGGGIRPGSSGGPGIPLPGDGSGGGDLGSGDPRDPRVPSPRTPSASSALEVQ